MPHWRLEINLVCLKKTRRNRLWWYGFWKASAFVKSNKFGKNRFLQKISTVKKLWPRVVVYANEQFLTYMFSLPLGESILEQISSTGFCSGCFFANKSFFWRVSAKNTIFEKFRLLENWTDIHFWLLYQTSFTEFCNSAQQMELIGLGMQILGGKQVLFLKKFDFGSSLADWSFFLTSYNILSGGNLWISFMHFKTYWGFGQKYYIWMFITFLLKKVKAKKYRKLSPAKVLPRLSSSWIRTKISGQ